ncbi:MAG: hypothetical protein GEEBNDBF_01339 [bacterium]|nr:hypothetical protein [bacterium]
MQPIRTLTLSLLASLLLLVPAMAEGPGHGHQHPGDGPCHCGGKDPAGHGGHPGMGKGPHQGGSYHGQQAKKHRRMGHMGLSKEDQRLLAKYPHREDSADYSWHPNRLRAAAIEFLAQDVYRLAILPLNDLSGIAPIGHDLNMVWAERMLRDTLAGSLLETGILVLPAENVEAAVIELKGLPDLRTSYLNYGAKGQDPLGTVFNSSLQGVDLSDTIKREASKRVAEYRSRNAAPASGMALGTLGTDYTAEEIRMMADALDVDGLIIGSISSWGDTKDSHLLGQIFPRRRGELVVNLYVLDGATGEPIYGTRQEVRNTSDWWNPSSSRAMTTGLARDFTGQLLRELSHPVPAWYVNHLRHAYGIDKAPQREYRKRGEGAPRERVANSGDANLQRWKQYTHHIDANERESKVNRIEREVREDRAAKNRR